MMKRIQAICFAILSIALIVFIFSNSIQPRDDSNARSLGITEFLKPILDPQNRIPEDTFNHYVRKSAHFCEFAALGFCLMGFADAVFSKKLLHFGIPIIGSLVVASLDETIQIFSDGRGPGVKDVLLDFSGALFGIAVMLILLWIIRNIRKRKSSNI